MLGLNGAGAPASAREEGVEPLVAFDHAGLHAAGEERIARLERIDEGRRCQAGTPAAEILELALLQGDAVGHAFPGERLDDQLGRPDLMERSADALLDAAAEDDVAVGSNKAVSSPRSPQPK